jgi:hypothetical protein
MLSSQEWWSVIGNYDKAILPWQFVIMGVGIVLTTLFAVKPDKKRALWIKSFLIVVNGWIAGGFFLNSARGFPSPISEFQGGLFIGIALFWLFDLIFYKTELAWPERKKGRIAAILSLLTVFLYPLWGLLLGHGSDRLIYPGTFPCPTVAYSLILIIMAKKKRNPFLYFLLFIWAIPFPPMVQIPQYGVYEDIIMFVLGLVALIQQIVHFLSYSVRLKTDADHTAQPGVILIIKGILKGYITHPGAFIAGTLLAFPGLIKKNSQKYPKDFLKSSGLILLIYKRLIPRIGQEKAFEVVRAVMLPVGLATQQANFRNVEEERTFENLIRYQQRTNKEGPTRLNKVVIEKQSGELYRFKVTRCLFFEFFDSQGAPELTKLMCSVDNAIFNTYLPEKVVFHREGTGHRMADGCPHCLFIVENLEK